MMELLGNAWIGWGDYITEGKLAALFIVALLYFWFYKKNESKKILVLYATIASVCCIFPVTAAVLMTYQTKFYDYEWIWSMVPLTAVIAYGMTVFLTDFYKSGKYKKSTGIAVAGICLAAILLCGSMGASKADSDSVYMKVLYPHGSDEKEDVLRRQAYDIVEELQELAGDEELILWAPIEVMEYAREVDASIRLLYGRNMWDISLNGYSYDTYDEAICNMFLWMELLNPDSDAESLLSLMGADEIPSTEVCIQKALETGVNCVLLPGGTDGETVQTVAGIFGGEVQQIEEYWVIYE